MNSTAHPAWVRHRSTLHHDCLWRYGRNLGYLAPARGRPQMCDCPPGHSAAAAALTDAADAASVYLLPLLL